MATGYVLTNKRAGKGDHHDELSALEVLCDLPLRYLDVTQITNYGAFLQGIGQEDYLIIAGGDGTLNHFVNNIAGMKLPDHILYYPSVPEMTLHGNWARNMGTLRSLSGNI